MWNPYVVWDPEEVSSEVDEKEQAKHPKVWPFDFPFPFVESVS